MGRTESQADSERQSEGKERDPVSTDGLPVTESGGEAKKRESEDENIPAKRTLGTAPSNHAAQWGGEECLLCTQERSKKDARGRK